MSRVVWATAAAAALAAAAVVAAGTDPDRARGGPGWGSLEPSPLSRTEVGATELDGIAYVMGGFVEGEDGDTGQMVAYDIAADEWTDPDELEPHPIAVNHAGVAAAGGHVYVHGGKRGRAQSPLSDRLTRYDPAEDEWKRLKDGPVPRMGMAFVASGDRLYAIGGQSPRTERLRRVDFYDISQRKWKRGPSLDVGRNHVAGALSDGTIYAMGGRPGPIDGGRRTVESWDLSEDRWRRDEPLATARSGAVAVTVADGDIVAYGGEELGGGTTIEQVERRDAATGEWSSLPDMVTPRHGLGGVADGNRVFALEGGPQPGLHFSNANEYLDVP
jgi:N-acetylneuraminic acid mutarotase